MSRKDYSVMNCAGIYKITSPSGRVYIGQAIDLKKRFRSYGHLCASFGMRKLYNSFTKYGIDNHDFCVVGYCEKHELNDKEKYFISFYDSVKKGLNCRTGGTTGSAISEEGRKVISRKMIEYFSKNRQKRSGLNHYMFGKHYTESHRAALSKSRIDKGSAKLGKNPKAKPVLHLLTGIFYECLKEACYAHNIGYSKARAQLQMRVKNNIDLIYI